MSFGHNKACMIDISRFRVPTIDRMQTMIKNISSYGFNQIFFNIEHTFKIKAMPFIGMDADGFTESEFKQLDDFAFQEGITLIPVMQSFGHMFHTLKWDKYKNLRETDSKWSVAVSSKETYLLIEEFFKACSDVFRSQYIHIGGDEVYDLAQGKSSYLLKNCTKGDIFRNHILKLKSIASKYDKEIFIWGDMVEKDSLFMKEIGKDVNLCYWNYGLSDMPSSYKDLKNKIYICPGLNTWKSFFPRIKFAKKNMAKRRQDFLAISAYGYMITDWGDAGHIHPFSLTEYMLKMSIDIMENKKLSSLNGCLQEIIDSLDTIHYGDYLNDKYVFNNCWCTTKMLYHDYIFSGKGLLSQNDSQLNTLVTKAVKLAKLVSQYQWSLDNEFEQDIRMFCWQTEILAFKIDLHLKFRSGFRYLELGDELEKLLFKTRRWFGLFMKRWLLQSQPMGLYYHIHFQKKMEKDLLAEISRLKELGNRDFSQMKTRYLYDDSEYESLIKVGSSRALNSLWDNFRL